VLYYNPLTETDAAAPSSGDTVLRYGLPDQVLQFAIGEDASFLSPTAGSSTLWEETIDRAAVLGLVLNDAAGQPAALASRLVTTSPATDLLLRGVLLSDYWLVTIPGQGALFVRAESNAWPFLKRTLLPLWLLDRPWHGPVEYRPTVGQGVANTAIVVGVAGAFAGHSGSAVERYNFTALDPARHSGTAVGELYLHLPGPQVAAQQ
jgi:hypothetical protein